MSASPRWSRPSTIIPAHVPTIGASNPRRAMLEERNAPVRPVDREMRRGPDHAERAQHRPARAVRHAPDRDEDEPGCEEQPPVERRRVPPVEERAADEQPGCDVEPEP